MAKEHAHENNGYSCIKHPFDEVRNDPEKKPRYIEDVNYCIKNKCPFLRRYGKPVFDREETANRKTRSNLQAETSYITTNSYVERRIKELWE